MVDRERLQPEEEKYTDLVQELRNVYRFRLEEEQMLARVQQRLAQDALALPAGEITEAPSSDLPARLAPSHERSPQPAGTRRPPSRPLNLLAAILLVGILVGALTLTLGVLHQRRNPSQGATPGTVSNAPVKNGFWFTEGIRLKMFTEQAGWALGDSQKTPYSRILHTVDGGHSWQDITPTNYLSSSSALDGDFYVLDEYTAWVPLVNPHLRGQGNMTGLLRTTDGGQTWQSMTVIDKYPDPQITFINQNEGWQLVTPVSADSNGSPPNLLATPASSTPPAPSVLYHTLDGGKTWQRLGPVPAWLYGFDMHFLNDQVGWAEATTVSEQVSEADAITGSAILYVTLDGGKTWSARSLPVPPGEKNNAIPARISLLNFTNASTGYLLASFSGGDYVYRTQNAGDSWQVLGGKLPDNNITMMLDSQHTVYPTFPVGLVALTLINNRWVSHSLALPEASNGNSLDLSFFSPQRGVVLISNSANSLDFYQTIDGGKIWTKLSSLPVAG